MSDLTDIRHEIERWIKGQWGKARRRYRRMGVKDRINRALLDHVDVVEAELNHAADMITDVICRAVFKEIGTDLSGERKQKIQDAIKATNDRVVSEIVSGITKLIDRLW